MLISTLVLFFFFFFLNIYICIKNYVHTREVYLSVYSAVEPVAVHVGLSLILDSLLYLSPFSCFSF